MPFRSRTSLISEAGSSTQQENERPTSSLSVEKVSTTIALTPMSRSQSDKGLPTPVTQRVTSPLSSRRKKRTRIVDSARARGLRVYWERFLRKMGSGTAPSSSSAIDDSTGESSTSNRTKPTEKEDPDIPLDEVVVDREWADDVKTSSVTNSDQGQSPDKSGGSNHLGGTNTDRDSLAIRSDGFWGSCLPLIWLRWRLWPFLHGFFSTRFLDEKSEEHYNKENWFLRKNLAVWSSLFYILNWILATAFTPKPAPLPDVIFYYAVMPLFTFPLLILVILDWPRDRPITYEIFLSFSTWSWGIYQLVFMRLCNFYLPNDPGIYSCQDKDFLATFYYTTGLQTIALFGLKQHRFPALLGMLAFLAVAFALVVPQRHQFSRYVVNFISFQIFLLYVHFMRENAERRLYTLRDQLKIQFRATQKAQVNERKASDSKRRLTSYVFHEVRVPLNTALLAVQNMEASGMVARGQEIEFKALEGSLSMMSKVLNDVLDFNRMDSGRFESVLKPYAFHKVMRSLFVPLQLATDARSLHFVTELDKSIDDVARRALYEAMGLSEEEIVKRLDLDEDGILVGDETRLRQIITNLASNACKFTPTGGKLTITTRLIKPSRLPRTMTLESTYSVREVPRDTSPPRPGPSTDSETPTCRDGDEGHVQLSASYLSQHNTIHAKPPPPLEFVVVRIEVTDSGCGIRRKDMVQSKLFSAFNQTEMGRQQGGKGTGLGLALVRQIVKLSGGRLGVRSRVGEGSTFWVELPLGVGIKALPGLKSVETPDSVGDHDYSLAGIMSGPGTSLPPRNLAQTFQPQTATPNRTTSALHSIMEQGGLVEISAKRDDNSPVLTRTIGDPSTGTDPTPPEAKEEASPTRSSCELPELPAHTVEPVARPNYVQLPAPQDFSRHGFPTSTGSSSTLVQGQGGAATPGTPGFEHGIKVLVVDDDPLTRKLMSRMLTRFGCKVSTAENGEMALEMILGIGGARNIGTTPSSEEPSSAGMSADGALGVRTSAGTDEPKYAVVFLDNQMPVLSGLETVAKLREMGRSDFVVGVTGNALLSDQQEYLEAGVDHVLTKPVFEKSLRAMLVIAEERRKRGTTPQNEVPDPAARS
ncbi:uncharacterized protein PHACADRAFT_152889 [Phanerochaete carnosa HHB-10118-sp]|uniref:histidine kinase n=1 Tax=Phanerochaete carnosa (strain HHB-10118-sp) TaxID=650164 RepID=K5VV46_PHACS|nr:uncharacterized protein PHACADRAFT_152889 [Phanerochaete carnosa HHB-10118-sp]EKM50685.1 hypothetical protein PHACADRAFT_152889 [Phanerochaete carnosa HHB-10118-sp]